MIPVGRCAMDDRLEEKVTCNWQYIVKASSAESTPEAEEESGYYYATISQYSA